MMFLAAFFKKILIMPSLSDSRRHSKLNFWLIGGLLFFIAFLFVFNYIGILKVEKEQVLNQVAKKELTTAVQANEDLSDTVEKAKITMTDTGQALEQTQAKKDDLRQQVETIKAAKTSKTAAVVKQNRVQYKNVTIPREVLIAVATEETLIAKIELASIREVYCVGNAEDTHTCRQQAG